jgi:hypothetical protein
VVIKNTVFMRTRGFWKSAGESAFPVLLLHTVRHHLGQIQKLGDLIGGFTLVQQGKDQGTSDDPDRSFPLVQKSFQLHPLPRLEESSTGIVVLVAHTYKTQNSTP